MSLTKKSLKSPSIPARKTSKKLSYRGITRLRVASLDERKSRKVCIFSAAVPSVDVAKYSKPKETTATAEITWYMMRSHNSVKYNDNLSQE